MGDQALRAAQQGGPGCDRQTRSAARRRHTRYTALTATPASRRSRSFDTRFSLVSPSGRHFTGGDSVPSRCRSKNAIHACPVNCSRMATRWRVSATLNVKFLT